MPEQVSTLTKADRIELAVAACREASGTSARKAAKIYNVTPSTVTRRLNKSVQPASIAHQSRQRLTPTEEQLVIQRAIQHHESGLPLNVRQLHVFANEILIRKDPDADEIGHHWHKKFLARNPILEQVLSRPAYRVQRSAVVRKETFEGFFELYSELRKTHQIVATDVYNMDERGFMMGVIRYSHILIPLQEKEAYLHQDEGRDWVSVMECVSAGGEALPTWAIFKGGDQQESWSAYLRAGSSDFATSENGWIDNGLGLDWLQQHFHPITERRRRGNFRLLIMDGHESHCTLEFVEFCANNKIILLFLPPHDSHLVRPLDTAIYQQLAKTYSTFLDDHSRFCGKSINKDDFVTYYQRARKEAVRDESLMSGWKKTGLLPFSPQEVLHQPRNPPLNRPPAHAAITAHHADEP